MLKSILSCAQKSFLTINIEEFGLWSGHAAKLKLSVLKEFEFIKINLKIKTQDFE